MKREIQLERGNTRVERSTTVEVTNPLRDPVGKEVTMVKRDPQPLR